MHAKFYENNPFRPPEWRAERVMRMVEHQPSPLPPRSFDDHYVRVYRRFLLLYLAAGKDENQRYAASMEKPEIYHAHMLRYQPDRQWRQILEARLLTHEPLAEIANRFSTEELAIEYYEKLFYNVRDRLKHTTWIAKVIIGPREYLAPNRHGTLTEDQRGFLYRLFAYHGGPLALDALIGMAPVKMPQSVADVPAWFDDALGQLVRSSAAAAVAALEVNQHTVMHLLKTALRPKGTGSVRKRIAASPQTDPAYLEEVAAIVERNLGRHNTPDTHKTRTTAASAAREPSKGDQPVNGQGIAAAPAARDVVPT